MVATYTIAAEARSMSVAPAPCRSGRSDSAGDAPFEKIRYSRFARSSGASTTAVLALMPRLSHSVHRMDGGAVAVRAMRGTPAGLAEAMARKLGRKSKPQETTQCASSTAIRPMPRFACQRARSCAPLLQASFSGVMYTRSNSPCSTRPSTVLSRCAPPKNVTRSPRESADSTWSCIRATSGVRTTERREVSSGGNW
eukprot:scaffold260047_cov37-Tisochrysis_lutea.AAC.3